MLKELVGAGEYTWFAELGLVLFVLVFVAVCARAALKPRKEVERMAWMPARDGEVPEGEQKETEP